jgi:ubiquinone/menaquinone biosynthesis C-methylase UbiE
MSFQTKFLSPVEVFRQVNLKEGEVAADFGCASGHFVFSAAKIVKDKGKVFAVDVQKTILSFLKKSISRRGFKNIKLIWANLEKPKATKIPKNSVDLVLISSTLHQVKDKKAVLLEAKRILKEKGRLLIIDWKPNAPSFGPPASLRLNEEHLKKEVQNAGFESTKELKVGAYHFGFLAQSP